MIGVLLAWIMLGERIGTIALVGGAAVLAGVALTSKRPPIRGGSPPPAGGRR